PVVFLVLVRGFALLACGAAPLGRPLFLVVIFIDRGPSLLGLDLVPGCRPGGLYRVSRRLGRCRVRLRTEHLAALGALDGLVGGWWAGQFQRDVTVRASDSDVGHIPFLPGGGDGVSWCGRWAPLPVYPAAWAASSGRCRSPRPGEGYGAGILRIRNDL